MTLFQKLPTETGSGPHLLEAPLRRAARQSFRAVQPFVLGPRVLDVGSAEGWIGELVSRQMHHDVQLLDVVDMNRTELPHRLYDGNSIPFPDGAFDTTLVMLTLHHCTDPEAVLREAIRVTRSRLIITESTYRTTPGRWMLWLMDSVVNACRSRCLMPEALHFRRVTEWRAVFREEGLHLRAQRHLSRGLHRHVVFVLDLHEEDAR